MTIALLTPAERLALSRERLRRAMVPNDAPASNGAASGTKSGGLDLLDLVKLAVPSASLVIDTLTQWWDGHRLQASGNLVEGVLDQLLRPLAKRHPLTLVASAVAFGAVLVWVRPWRWALKPQVLNTWGPAMFSTVIASSAVQGWLLDVLTKNAAAPTKASQTPYPSTAEPAEPRPPT